MGWGDVKLFAAIGAFIGIPGALFSLFCASLSGMFVGIWLLGRRCQSSMLIPFGPFLALGAVIWILGGKNLWDIYFFHLGFSSISINVEDIKFLYNILIMKR